MDNESRAKALMCAASHWAHSQGRCYVCRDDHEVWEVYLLGCDIGGPWNFAYDVAASMALSEAAALGFDADVL